jgi:copper chaperone CopZ
MNFRIDYGAVLLFGFAVLGCSEATNPPFRASSQPAAIAVFNAAGAPIVEFSVPDMMCEEGCATTVRDILSHHPGVKDVRVDFEAKKATVAIEEDDFDPQQAIAALIDKGFDHSILVTDVAAKPQAAGEAAD